ncbi:hypothetical protein CRE_27984 [Caenorhabditis remanei]|uniref:Uncharacterized protein n=1 Tax=Caenorhabditis remanei TaxID=31234 RepID=E3NT00_CAERE|nr:hypothetical protein CRE_27984 [Caenorhabditis remanei]
MFSFIVAPCIPANIFSSFQSLLQYPLNYLVIEYQLLSVVRQESEINVRNSVQLFSVELNSFIIYSQLTAHVNQPLSVVLMMEMRTLEALEDSQKEFDVC